MKTNGRNRKCGATRKVHRNRRWEEREEWYESRHGPKPGAFDGVPRMGRAIRFSDGEWARLAELAEAEGETVSEYVRGRCL